jgi:hypothetical protein
MKHIKTFESFINEVDLPGDEWYRELGVHSDKGKPLSKVQANKFVKYITRKVTAQTEFELQDINDNSTEFFFYTRDNIAIGVSLIKRGSNFVWKAMCSDRSLEQGGADTEGSATDIEDVVEDVFDFISTASDTLLNG